MKQGIIKAPFKNKSTKVKETSTLVKNGLKLFLYFFLTHHYQLRHIPLRKLILYLSSLCVVCHLCTARPRSSICNQIVLTLDYYFPSAMCEMMKIMQENREVTCCLGSSANFRNTRLFLQSDVRYTDTN